MRRCIPFLSILLLIMPYTGEAACSPSCSSSSSSCESCPSMSCCSLSSSSCSSSYSSDDCGCGSTLYLPRPQGLNNAALFNPYYYSEDLPDTYVTAMLGYRYEQTKKANRIARCLFGTDTLTFTGTQVAHRGNNQLIADYFGLGSGFKGTLELDPRIKDNIIDFVATVELGNMADCLEGLYLRFNSSLVHSSWNLNPCATAIPIDSTLATPDLYPACYVGGDSARTTNSIREALGGDFIFGDMNEEWHFGRFDFQPQSITRVANIDVILGYDFLRCEQYHIGAFLKTVAPTGNRPEAKTIFEPIVGNGHHWELGLGVDTHCTLWRSDDQVLSFYFYGSFTHLFKDKQWRSFDFKPSDINTGCMSRYMLLKEFNADGSYANHIINGINFATRKVKSSFDIQGESTFRFLYRNCGWTLTAGYNLYGRTQEKISNACCDCSDVNGRRFGIKGDAGTCASHDATHVSLSSTENSARMYKTAPIDNPTLLPGFKDWKGDPAINSEKAGKAAPVIISCNDLCFTGVPSQFIHKIFGAINYQWNETDCTPYVGFGGEVDIANNGKHNVCTPNKWGIWLQGGLFF